MGGKKNKIKHKPEVDIDIATWPADEGGKDIAYKVVSYLLPTIQPKPRAVCVTV